MCRERSSKSFAAKRLLLAAGINRLAYFRDLFRSAPQLVIACRDFHTQLLKDGNIDPVNAPPLGYAHLTTAEEFRKLFEARFHQIALIGTESFTSSCQESAVDLASGELEAWLDLVEATGTTLEGLGVSDHFLYLGKKKSAALMA